MAVAGRPTLVFPDAKEQKSMIDGIPSSASSWLLLTHRMRRSRFGQEIRPAAAAFLDRGSGSIPPAGYARLALPESLLPDPTSACSHRLFLRRPVDLPRSRIVAAIVRGDEFHAPQSGQVIVASAIMEVSIGWIIIPSTFGLAEAGNDRSRQRCHDRLERRFLLRELHGRAADRLLFDPMGHDNLQTNSR